MLSKKTFWFRSSVPGVWNLSSLLMFISNCAAMPFCLLLLSRVQEWYLKLVDVEEGEEMAIRPHLRYYLTTLLSKRFAMSRVIELSLTS